MEPDVPQAAALLVFCFDIDGTILTLVEDGNYENATPIPGRVEHLRALKESGHTIKLFTARGSKSGVDWRERTEAQLRQFSVPYDELIFGKPHADLYVDDKACHPNDYLWQISKPLTIVELIRERTEGS